MSQESRSRRELIEAHVQALRRHLAELTDLLREEDGPLLSRLAERVDSLVEETAWELGMGELEWDHDAPKFDHAGLAVADLEKAGEFFIGLLGGTLHSGGTNDSAGLRSLIVKYPAGGKIELLQAVADNPVAKFVAKRGEGVHHLTFFVKDLRASIEKFERAGCKVVGADFSSPNWCEAYISPPSAHGCLVQIVQVSQAYGKSGEGITVEAVLADQWEWIDQNPRPRSLPGKSEP